MLVWFENSWFVVMTVMLRMTEIRRGRPREAWGCNTPDARAQGTFRGMTDRRKTTTLERFIVIRPGFVYIQSFRVKSV
jgi:hypothetical protein